jgi:hypothetical protein
VANPTHRTSHGRVQLRVACRKRDKGRHPAVSGNDEISPGVSWRLTRAARYPLDPPAIAQFFGLGNWLISKVRVSRLDRARTEERDVLIELLKRLGKHAEELMRRTGGPGGVAAARLV